MQRCEILRTEYIGYGREEMQNPSREQPYKFGDMGNSQKYNSPLFTFYFTVYTANLKKLEIISYSIHNLAKTLNSFRLLSIPNNALSDAF